MSRRTQIYVLIGLLAVLAYLAYSQLGHPSVPGISGVMAADTKFEPLDVREPALRVEELEKLRKQEPSGNHRNIFLAAPPPAPKQTVPTEPAIVGAPFPVKPPPPEPPHVNAEFFGYALQTRSGRHVAFFTSGDEVLVVPEGDRFLNSFRLVRIGNESADVEEISTGRHVTLPLVQPPDQGAGNQ